MPIMAMHQRNDARGSARLLAGAAKDVISGKSTAQSDIRSLGNMYRLFEVYKSGRFSVREPRPRVDKAAMALSTLPQGRRHLTDVQRAFDAASGRVFGSVPTAAVLSHLEKVLFAAARPELAHQVSKDEQQTAIYFFEAFIEAL